MTENNESQKTETKLEIKANAHGLVLQTINDMYRFAQYVVVSRLAPKSFQTPEQILIAIQSGAELSMPPMRSLQSFCVVNGQARLWGDAPLALVRQSGNLEYIKEWIEGEDEKMIAYCETKRKSDPNSITREFSVDDAKLAGLWKKAGTWQTYPKLMLKYRARSTNLRDNFPDAFGGSTIAEEYEGVEMNEAPLNDKPRSAILLETPEQPEVALEIPEITPRKPVEAQTPVTLTETTPESIIKAPKVRHKKALSKEEVEKNAEEKLGEYKFRCNNPKCGLLFDEPAGQGEKPLCPKCLTSKVTEFKKNETFA